MTVSTVCCSRFGSGSMVVSPITQCFIKLCVETALQKLRYRFLEQPLDISSIPVTFALLSSSRISSRLASSSGVLFLPISFSSILSLLLYTIHGVYTRFGMVSIPPGVPTENRLTVRVERFFFCRRNPRSAHFPLFECAIKFIRSIRYPCSGTDFFHFRLIFTLLIDLLFSGSQNLQCTLRQLRLPLPLCVRTCQLLR